MIDGIIQFGVDDSLSAPPSSSSDGAIFRIAPAATGDWAGKDDQIAMRISGAWNYSIPKEGMRVFDRSAQQFLLFKTSWVAPVEPELPTGGAVIDQEARSAVDGVIQALRNAGIFTSAT
ncbi:DUF2793 domain-containing protein [Erythrobacter sp. WH158]|uniref:DUF2793 domain-containing protein n=2 Tax=Erythrobacter crassostreae TaxID=2828328 RepID=A0A9X1JLJ2_9SPHN|nr:DUF2793 domain-containing protein [Erythrobacter crassostrea]